jgi:hypothetical protein
MKLSLRIFIYSARYTQEGHSTSTVASSRIPIQVCPRSVGGGRGATRGSAHKIFKITLRSLSSKAVENGSDL